MLRNPFTLGNVRFLFHPRYAFELKHGLLNTYFETGNLSTNDQVQDILNALCIGEVGFPTLIRRNERYKNKLKRNKLLTW